MAEEFPVRVSAGSLRAGDAAGWTLPHAWTERGILVEAQGTGAHLMHAAIAVCVLNDTYREAGAMGVAVRGVMAAASGGFDEAWSSTGIGYTIEVDADPADADALLARVEEVAEIPRAIRAGADVRRVSP